MSGLHKSNKTHTVLPHPQIHTARAHTCTCTHTHLYTPATREINDSLCYHSPPSDYQKHWHLLARHSVSSTLLCVCVAVCVCGAPHYIALTIKDFHLSNAIRRMRKGERVAEGTRERKKKGAQVESGLLNLCRLTERADRAAGERFNPPVVARISPPIYHRLCLFFFASLSFSLPSHPFLQPLLLSG